jgi:hypothetical protein
MSDKIDQFYREELMSLRDKLDAAIKSEKLSEIRTMSDQLTQLFHKVSSSLYGH